MEKIAKIQPKPNLPEISKNFRELGNLRNKIAHSGGIMIKVDGSYKVINPQDKPEDWVANEPGEAWRDLSKKVVDYQEIFKSFNKKFEETRKDLINLLPRTRCLRPEHDK